MAVQRDIGINVRVRSSGADELTRAKKELAEMRTVLRLAAENARKLGRENDRLEKELRDVSRELGLSLPDGPYTTLGGLILDLAGRIPDPGAAVATGEARFVVLQMDRNRIARVRIEVGKPI